MFEIEISIERITDYSNFPGWVECILYDAWNHKHIFRDKITVFICDNINSKSVFPQRGVIRCELIKEWTDDTGRKILTVSTENPDHVESLDGITDFDLLENQISPCTA